MINLLWSGVVMVLLLSGCGWNGTPTRTNDFTPLTSIEIAAVSPAIANLTSTKLSVKGHFSGLYTRDITDQAVWSSGSPAVAGFITATSPSRVTGLSPGTAILTATVGSVSATYTVTVSPATVSLLTVTPAAPSIAEGLTTQFSASGTFSDGTTQDLTFDAVWASSASGVATVSDAAGSKGYTQTVAAGTATISATFAGISGTTLLTVTEPVLQSITVTPSSPSILTLSTGSFKATGNYSDGSAPDITSLVAWSSSNTAVATIDSGGAVATHVQGTTAISATLGGVTGSSSLKVTGGNLNANGIVISPLAPKLVKDTTVRMTATGIFSNGSTRDITGAVEWSVANATAETTKAGGNRVVLKALAVTPATVITATSGTVTATATLTVVAPQLTSIALSATSLNLTAGTSGPLTVAATFSDGTIQDVTAISTWTSSDVTKATVSTSGYAAGRVTGAASGTATISAAYGGKTVSTTVTVRARTLLDLTISGPYGVAAGNQASFTALATYSDGSSVFVTEDATWTIDKSSVAILADGVNQPGQVVGVDSGFATLTAGFGGKTKTMTVTVP